MEEEEEEQEADDAACGDDIAAAAAAAGAGAAGDGGDDSGADSVRHWALPRRIAFAWIVPTRQRLRRRTAGAADWGAVKPPAKRCRKNKKSEGEIGREGNAC